MQSWKKQKLYSNMFFSTYWKMSGSGAWLISLFRFADHLSKFLWCVISWDFLVQRGQTLWVSGTQQVPIPAAGEAIEPTVVCQTHLQALKDFLRERESGETPDPRPGVGAR